MKCRCCKRDAVHWDWFKSHCLRTHISLPTCSRVCLEEYQRIRELDGLSPSEVLAIQDAAKAAGEYLDSIGKTDLAKMTETEWLTLSECIVCTALDVLAKVSLANIPFPELVAKAEEGFKR
jgi:Family of unknown function (DUF6511)